MELIRGKRAEHLDVVRDVLLRARWADESKFIPSANTHVILYLSARRGNAIGHLLIRVINE
jgi:hypothetical protein